MENSTVGLSAAVVMALVFGGPMNGSATRQAPGTDRMLDASVSVRTISHVTIDRFGDSVWHPGSGSGVLISTQGCEVWTNHHVIANAAVIEVLPRGVGATRGIPARVVNSSPRTDIAILELERCDGIAQAELGDSDRVRQGDEVYAVGNPLGSNPDSISRGIISHVERYLGGPTPYLQTDANINPGNSGGALFDKAGTVIGISTAIATDTRGANTGIGYAIPINLARQVVAELHDGPPSWGDAGIGGLLAGLTVEEAQIFRVPDGFGAVNVTDAPQEGPSAGKLQARDVIYRINDIGVTNPDQVERTITSFSAGATITFHLVRNGQLRTVDVQLAEGGKRDAGSYADYYEGLLGLEFEMWSDADDSERAQFTTPVITRVHNMGPAHLGKITSSQTTVVTRGPMLFPYLLSVNAITGIVVDGDYRAVTDIGELQDAARAAYEDGLPMLLEIEIWQRNPQAVNEPLRNLSTAFFRVSPSPTSAIGAHPDAASLDGIATPSG